MKTTRLPAGWVGVDALIEAGVRMPMALYHELLTSKYVGVRANELGQLVLSISYMASVAFRQRVYDALRDAAWHYDYDSRAVFYYFGDPDEPRFANPRSADAAPEMDERFADHLLQTPSLPEWRKTRAWRVGAVGDARLLIKRRRGSFGWQYLWYVESRVGVVAAGTACDDAARGLRFVTGASAVRRDRRRSGVYRSVLRELRRLVGSAIESDASLTRGAIGAWEAAGGEVQDRSDGSRYRIKNPRGRQRNPSPHRGYVDFVGRDGLEHRVQIYRRRPREAVWVVSYIGHGGALWYDEVSGHVRRDDAGDSITVATVHHSEGDSVLTGREMRAAREDPVGYLAARFGMPLFVALAGAVE